MGVWQGIYDPNDRIEILSGSKARVTALLGQPIEAWYRIAPAMTEMGQVMADAERALARFEMVDVEYTRDKKAGTLTFVSQTRGRRVLEWDRTDLMDDPAWSLRTYLYQK